ncbi:hypothetical protein MMC25_003973 [Agyrium rufum]|nr:hypothetical protein [Agyrium rufum]
MVGVSTSSFENSSATLKAPIETLERCTLSPEPAEFEEISDDEDVSFLFSICSTPSKTQREQNSLSTSPTKDATAGVISAYLTQSNSVTSQPSTSAAVSSNQSRKVSRKKLLAMRNPPLTFPWISVRTHRANQITLTINSCVQLRDNCYLQIKHIFRHEITRAVIIRGLLLRSISDLNDYLHDRDPNEVYIAEDIDLDDDREASIQTLYEININDVLRLRDLVLTNRPLSTSAPNVAQEDENATLICGIRYTRSFTEASDRLDSKAKFQSLLHLRADECNVHHAFDDADVLRVMFRRETDEGGSALGASNQELDHLTEEEFTRNQALQELKTHADTAQVLPLSASLEFTGHATLSTANQIVKVDSLLKQKFTLYSPTPSPTPLEHNAYSLTTVPTVFLQKLLDELAGQRYSFGDAFCCGGGVSRGAVMAGLHVAWGFDNNPKACSTWAMNFPYAKMHCKSVDEFVARPVSNLDKVDILHLSPPCQPFSPAHTHEGRNDEANTAASLCIGPMLERCRPRIVTLENTFGMTRYVKHQDWYNALISQFTSVGYSIRWGVINFADYGLPQSRKRLIIIAACPGEVLPQFPPPTHSRYPKPGLRIWATINGTINNKVPPRWDRHNIEPMGSGTARPGVPYDGNIQAPCITTGGGQQSGGQGQRHPSGRLFTVRELAILQGFPLEHKWQGTATTAKHQIGNAVPPCVAKIFLEHIKNALSKTDSARASIARLKALVAKKTRTQPNICSSGIDGIVPVSAQSKKRKRSETIETGERERKRTIVVLD